jgi:8-oxo-dGTP pyrophosphatase MutT (NUDIX family)
MSRIAEEKPETIRIEAIEEEQTEKNNEEIGTPKKVDFTKVFSTAMAQMSSNIRKQPNKQPNKRTKREETFFEEEEEDSSEEEFSEDEDSESEEEDIRWTSINKLLESHLNITETILTMVKETKND